jgi:hypothetical protein
MPRNLFRKTTRSSVGVRKPSRLWGTVRVLTYAMLVSFAFTALSLRSVYGDVESSALAVGREMLKLKDVIGPPQPIVLNGTTMFVGGRHVAHSVHEVLDRFEQYCGDNAGGFEQEFAKVPAAQLDKLPEWQRSARHIGTIRSEVDDEEGFLSCVVAPEGSRGFRGLVSRAEAFAETGDLGKIGKLRYVFAHKNAKAGGADLVTLWHEGSFDVMKMLFSSGDVPGHDTVSFPRPTGSIRVLSAEVPGTGYGLRAYETKQPAADVLSSYDSTLPALGWDPQPTPHGPEGELMAESSRAFIRGGAVVFVSASAEKGGTFVELAEMGTRGAVIVQAAVPVGGPQDPPPGDPSNVESR